MTIETAWFIILAAFVAIYVILDGFDLGAGSIHLFAGRSDPERAQILRTIGPVWDGNEVWLIIAAASLALAFPAVYASAFSGFYLSLMILLWLLIGRGIAIEFRRHLDGPVWRPFWDSIFAVSSALLTFMFGVALGNIVRGVPLDRSGAFFEPLWGDPGPGGRPGILDGYTLLTGVTAVSALAMHGAFWVAMRTSGPVNARASRIARLAWGATAVLGVLVTIATLRVQPQVSAQVRSHPWGLAFPALAATGLVAARIWTAKGAERKAFLASGAALAGLIASAAFGIHPYVLPSSGDAALGLTVGGAASSPAMLKAGLVWMVPGMVLIAGFTAYVYRGCAKKVGDEEY